MAGQEENRLTLREHLEELRKRLFVVAIAMTLGTAVAFVLHREILKLLMEPADDLLSGTGAGLIYTQLTENLGVAMKVSLLSGFILALPVVVYELVMFIAPGLTPRERRYLLMFLPAVVFTFALGVLFGYFVLLPPALRFLLTFDADIAMPMIRVGNYMSIVTRLLFWLGIVFEIPILIFLLAKLRLQQKIALAEQQVGEAVGGIGRPAVAVAVADHRVAGRGVLPVARPELGAGIGVAEPQHPAGAGARQRLEGEERQQVGLVHGREGGHPEADLGHVQAEVALGGDMGVDQRL